MIDVDRHIKYYWERLLGSVDVEERFVDPNCAEHCMRASTFLKYLDLEPLMPVLNKYYKVKEDEETYPRRAMFKALLWRRIKGLKWYTKLHKELITHPEEAKELGFKEEAGEIAIPSARSLNHFEGTRLGLDGLNELFTALSKLVVKKGKTLGMEIGRQTTVDSIPIETVANDSEGVWNEHYKLKMAKLHVVADLKENIPLSKAISSGTSGDGEQFTQLYNDAKTIVGERVMEEMWFDGSYTSNEILAWMHTEGIRAYYHITTSWNLVSFKHCYRGRFYYFSPEQEIEWQYQKLWKKPYFKRDCTLEYKMKCLITEGINEPVAMFYRNARLLEYEESPEGVLEVYNVRASHREGFHGYLKEQYHLEQHNSKGLKQLDRHLTGTLVTVLAVALTRLQQGISQNLISIAHLT